MTPSGKNEPCGLLLFDKAPGLTSFQSLDAVKRALGTSKVGHTGTLDKFASGLLAVLVGRAARLAAYFLGCPKEYDGVIRFGAETATLDPEGEIVAEAPLPSREAVENALAAFRGDILQAPPAYSALHVGGRRASELARAGTPPDMKKRPVSVYCLEITAWNPPLAGVRVRCSAGTYIRSLARDIALAAGSRAHLAALRRTKIGGFTVEEAASGGSDLSGALRPIDRAVFEALGMPVIAVNEAEAAALRHGKPLLSFARPPWTCLDAPAAAVFNGADLAAVLQKRGGRWAYGLVW